MIQYIFYIREKKEEQYEYDLSKNTKEEIYNDVMYNVFPNNFQCIKEKWEEWIKKYSSKFYLEDRRQDPNFISDYKRHIN